MLQRGRMFVWSRKQAKRMLAGGPETDADHLEKLILEEAQHEDNDQVIWRVMQ